MLWGNHLAQGVGYDQDWRVRPADDRWKGKGEEEVAETKKFDVDEGKSILVEEKAFIFG